MVLKESHKKILASMLQNQLDYLDDPEDHTVGGHLNNTKNTAKEVARSSKYVNTVETNLDSSLSDCVENELLALKCREIVKELVLEDTTSEYETEDRQCKPGTSKYLLRNENMSNAYKNTLINYAENILPSCTDNELSDDLSHSSESWRANLHGNLIDSSSSTDLSIEDKPAPKNNVKVTTKCKEKCIVRRKSTAKNLNKPQDDNAGSKSTSFDPNVIPEFLSLPNTDVVHLFKEKKFEEWNMAYTNWFVDKDRVAFKKPTNKTIQQYISELCRYGQYVQEAMKEKNISWHLNDLLMFNKKKGSTFNAQNGITFFEDPMQYMIEENLPLPRKLKLLMALVHATEFISSTIIPGKKDCTLSITDSASRQSVLTTFKDDLLKLYASISSSNFCHRQEDRLMIHEHKGSEIPVDFLKKILNIWVYSNLRRELYAKLFHFEDYLNKFCTDNKYPVIDTNQESLGMDKWPEDEITRLKSSKKFAHETSELRSHLGLEILSLGIGHRAQIVTSIKIKDIILPSLIDGEINDMVLSDTKTRSKYGLCYCPIDKTTLEGCLVYLRIIRTIYQGHYKDIEDWPQKSLFVTHSKNSKELSKPSQTMDQLLKRAVAEKNGDLLTGTYRWSLVDLRSQVASYLNEGTQISSEAKEISSHLMQHSSIIRDSTYSSISTMKKRAKEFKEGYNNWITEGKDMPSIYAPSQSKFLEKSKEDLTEELKRKDEATRMRKHHKMATTGSQFMHKYESNWLWDFWNLPSIKSRWRIRNEKDHPSKRALLREFMTQYHVFNLIVHRLLERKIRRNSKANVNTVLDTLISSNKSFDSNSKF